MIAPIDEAADGHRDNDGMEHMRPFDQDAEEAMNGDDAVPGDDDAIDDYAHDDD